MFFEKAKSVKKAVFGRSTWLVRRGQQERKEGKKWRWTEGFLVVEKRPTKLEG